MSNFCCNIRIDFYPSWSGNSYTDLGCFDNSPNLIQLKRLIESNYKLKDDASYIVVDDKGAEITLDENESIPSNCIVFIDNKSIDKWKIGFYKVEIKSFK